MKLETSEEERVVFRHIVDLQTAAGDPPTRMVARLLRDIDTLLAEVERLRTAPPAPPLPAEVEEMRKRIDALPSCCDHDCLGRCRECPDAVLRDAASLLSRWPGGQAPEPTNES